MEECESCKAGKMKAAIHWEVPGKQSGYLLPPKNEEDARKTCLKILEKCKNSKLKGGAPYFESVEDMRIFLNGEDIDLEVFHLCVQPGAHIHVCNKRDAFPDVFLDNSPCVTSPITLKPPRKGKPRDLDEFWEDCTKGRSGDVASVPWKVFFGIFSSCTKRYSKINEEIADQKLRKIEKSFKKLIAHKQDKASFVSRDSWDSFFKWCKQEVSAERKHELNFEPIVAIIAALLGLVYCKGIKFMKWHSTNTGADGSDESTSSSSERVYTDWDLYEEEEKKQQKRRADENKGKIIVKIRFSRSLPLAFRVAFVEIGKAYNDENDLLLQFFSKDKISFYRIKEDPKHKKYTDLMAALRRLYRLHYRKLNLDKSDLPEGLRSVDEAAFMSPEHFFCAQKARIEEETAQDSDLPAEKGEKELKEEREKHTETLKERLKKFNFEWSEEKFCPDVYTAISNLLYKNPDISKHVRNETANWLANHGRSYSIDEDTKLMDYITMDFDSLVSAVRRGKDANGMADHIVLHAIAEAFNQVLVVITSIPMGEHVLIIRPKEIRQKQCLYLALLVCRPVQWSPLQPLSEDSKRPWYIPPQLITEDTNVRGAGNFGSVTKGKLRNETTVAIKRMHTVTDKQIFLSELEVLHHVGGPNIVQFYGASDDDHNQFLVFEWMPRGSLYNHIHMKKLKKGDGQTVKRSVKEWNKRVLRNPLLVVSIAKNIANGIRFIHSKKILHRDLTSKNVLLDKNYRAKICDFGLSCIQKDAKTYHRPGHICYLAPEVLNGLADHSPLHFNFAADVFSFAIILWELWTGQDPPPYNLDLSNEEVRNEWIQRVTQGHDRPSLPSNMPSYWKNLITDCWHPDPEARPMFTGTSSIASRLKSIHQQLKLAKALSKEHLRLGTQEEEEGSNNQTKETKHSREESSNEGKRKGDESGEKHEVRGGERAVDKSNREPSDDDQSRRPTRQKKPLSRDSSSAADNPQLRRYPSRESSSERRFTKDSSNPKEGTIKEEGREKGGESTSSDEEVLTSVMSPYPEVHPTEAGDEDVDASFLASASASEKKVKRRSHYMNAEEVASSFES